MGWTVAGQYRVLNIEKPEPALGGISIEYADFKDIETELVSAISDFKAIDWHTLALEDSAVKFSKCMSRIWKIHPFREGNTRTVVTFCCQYAESIGLILNAGVFEKNSVYLRSALVAATAVFSDLGDYSKPEFLNRIVEDALR